MILKFEDFIREYREYTQDEMDIQLYVDIIDDISDKVSDKKEEYIKILKDKYGFNYGKPKDDFYIQNPDLNDVKKMSNFSSFQKFKEYAKSVWRKRGFHKIELNRINETLITETIAKEIGLKLNFDVVFTKEYEETFNYASVGQNKMKIPTPVDIYTFIHELGHIYDNQNKLSDNLGLASEITFSATLYGITNGNECFAENFMYYFLFKDWLKRNLIEVYLYLDKIISNTWKKEIYRLLM